MGSLESKIKLKIRGILHNLQAKVEGRFVHERLKHYDGNSIVNTLPKKVESILFVIERMALHSGGQTSILRLGTRLSELGYEVGYVVYKKQSKETMMDIASKNLNGYKGIMYDNTKLYGLNFDIVIASSWDTVSFVKKLPGYKMYFVQDYEPYFFSYGELFIMAKKTYEQGLHMVSLGDWNKEMIEKSCKITSKVDRVDFPYEKKEYPEIKRNYKSYETKKEFTIAVYLKYYGKRLPNISQYLFSQLSNLFEQDGIKLNIKYFGEDKSFITKGGVNLGLLNKSQLFELYKEADFGFVVSLSNISLVPYEMLATGLPLIEFEDGTFSYFFQENTAILCGLSSEELYTKLKEVIEDSSKIEEMMKKANEVLSTLSWEKTGEQFHSILQGLTTSNEIENNY